MTLKKTAVSKRALLPRAADYTKEFLKDWERLNRSGRYNMIRLREVMLLLIANEKPLDPEWLDHQLIGNWHGHRECHIGGDFLLTYRLEDKKNTAWLFLSEPVLTLIYLNSKIDCFS